MAETREATFNYDWEKYVWHSLNLNSGGGVVYHYTLAENNTDWNNLGAVGYLAPNVMLVLHLDEFDELVAKSKTSHEFELALQELADRR